MRFKYWLESVDKWTDIKSPPKKPYYDLDEIPPKLYEKWGLPQGRWYWLSKVYVPPTMRGGGLGKDLVRKAQSQVPVGGGILLHADPIGEDANLDVNQLKDFYGSLGFRSWPVGQRNDYMVWVKRR
jgi:GNAT superfamily N-acetyltransferase